MKKENLISLMKKEKPDSSDVGKAFNEYERRINIIEEITLDLQKKLGSSSTLYKNIEEQMREPLEAEDYVHFDLEEHLDEIIREQKYELIEEVLAKIKSWDNGDLKYAYYRFAIDINKGLPEIAIERILDVIDKTNIDRTNNRIFYKTAKYLEDSGYNDKAYQIYKKMTVKGLDFKDSTERYKELRDTQTPGSRSSNTPASTPTPAPTPSSSSKPVRGMYTEQTIMGSSISGERYVVVRRVGSGGMGEVYEGKDTTLDRVVAIKMMKEELTLRQREKKRFLREARTSAKLNHPNIVTIYDVVDEEERVFLVLEYVKGKRLADMIDEDRLSSEHIKDYATDILQALAYAHKNQIIHRDIKPTNVMITGEGQAKLLDFGIARIAYNTMASMSMNTSGTPVYMAPEQHLGEKVDERSDIYGFGVMLYEMITGELPFRGTDLLLLKREKGVDVSSIENETYKEIIKKCTEPDREKRYADVKEILEIM